ncbi:aldehyde dehydrogenase 3, member A2, partial [Spiromyces aspiralis]
MPAIGAIAAGNTLVLKLSEICEHTTAALARLIEAYLDPDCFQVVQGGADETTQLLKEKFDHFFYTGNGNVGRIIAKAAAEQLARVTLELGGKCPVIVTKNCSDIQIAVSRLMWGKLTNAGQTCVAPDYMLVERDVYAPVIEAIKLYLHNVYGSDP